MNNSTATVKIPVSETIYFRNYLVGKKWSAGRSYLQTLFKNIPA